MKNFELYNPVKVFFGAGETANIGERVKNLGKKALVVSYENPVYFESLFKKINMSLDDAGISYVEFFKIQANPLISHIREAVELAKSEEVDFVIGVGGGSVMDSAKVIAAGVKYDRDVWDMFVTRHDIEVGVAPTATIPSVMVPTLPATSSEMNCISVVTNDETCEKAYVSNVVLYPHTSIIDPELTCSLPAFQTAAGAVDAISHAMEAYFSGDQNSPLQDRLHEGIIITIMDEVKKVLADPNNIEHRSNIQWAASLAWNGYLQSGLYATTPMHKLGHVLSARYNTTHGVTLAIFMNALSRYTCKANAARFALFGEKVFSIDRKSMNDEEAASLTVDKLVEFIKSIGIPVTLTEIGVDESEIEAIADDVVKQGCDADGMLASIPPIDRNGIIETLKLAL